MSVILELCSGWTGILGPFTLRVDGAPINLSGYQVELLLRRGDWSLVAITGTVDVPDQGLFPGEVQFNPGTDDFTLTGSQTVQIYHMHWKVTDQNSKIIFFPNNEADQIRVYQA